MFSFNTGQKFSYFKTEGDGEGVNEKKILLVDFDNTIVDWEPRLHDLLPGVENKEPIKHTAKYEVNLLKKFPEQKKAILQRIGEKGFTYTSPDDCLRPFPGAIEGLKTLNEHYDVYICSANDPDHIYNPSEKHMWVKHFLGDEWVNKLILTKSKNLVRGDYLLDDGKSYSTKTFMPAPLWKHIPYGYDYPWNWEQVVHFFKEQLNN